MTSELDAAYEAWIAEQPDATRIDAKDPAVRRVPMPDQWKGLSGPELAA
jgi:hypothetical protein